MAEHRNRKVWPAGEFHHHLQTHETIGIQNNRIPSPSAPPGVDSLTHNGHNEAEVSNLTQRMFIEHILCAGHYVQVLGRQQSHGDFNLLGIKIEEQKE